MEFRGGIQSMAKYKKSFLNKGMLGSFILPFFVVSWFLGLFGLGVLVYRVVQRVIVQFLSAKYSVGAQTAILTMRDINLTPNILVFFGVAILILSFSFMLLALMHSREKEFKKHGILILIVYAFFYLLAYPLILLSAAFKFITGKTKW